MKKLFRSEQSGRSMVEMLGVLAIIGVLSVAGISGYSKAMAKFKVSKTMDQVAMLVANLRTIYAGQRNYTGLNTTVAVQIGAIPEDMIQRSSTQNAEGQTQTNITVNNAFNGEVVIGTVASNGIANGGFYVTYTDLSRDACATIATSDWGSGSQSGLLAMTVDSANAKISSGATVPDSTSGKNTVSTDLPITPANAATQCDSATNSVTWYYF